MADLLFLVLPLLAVGLFAGFLGGLFGIGGGVVIVPALYAASGQLGVPEDARIKLAVGTSLATIIITSIRSLRAHQKHGAVDVALLKNWMGLLACGAILGAVIARYASGDGLTIFFAVAVFLVALQKLRPLKPTPEREGFPPLPNNVIRIPSTLIIGTASSLMGIGGGVMAVIVLTSIGRTIHQAIATAAGFGLAIAVPGTLGFMLAGQGVSGLPLGSIGFVNLPAFAVIAAMTFLTAPLGAKLAHKLDKTWLNRIFAGYLCITACLMLRDALLS